MSKSLSAVMLEHGTTSVQIRSRDLEFQGHLVPQGQIACKCFRTINLKHSTKTRHGSDQTVVALGLQPCTAGSLNEGKPRSLLAP